jgi:hypothetical protein
MAPKSTSASTITPLTARKTWRTVEPLHGMIYFAPEAAESYARLGIRHEAGYFASRSAPMGAVGADTVIATFYNFRPELVRGAMTGVWDLAPPPAVLRAREEAADAALRRMLGAAIDSPEMERAASLVRRAAERATERCAGRPLFAGHAGLPWPETPHVVVWHAQTLLREFRGDGHLAALIMNDLDPVEALVMHAASGEVPVPFLRSSRGWTDTEWEEGAARLRRRGWLAPGDGEAQPLSLSEAGAVVRQAIEDRTDELALFPYEALSEEECAELRTLVRPFSRAVVDAAGFGV